MHKFTLFFVNTIAILTENIKILQFIVLHTLIFVCIMNITGINCNILR